MTEQITSWGDKHILKIKSEPLHEVKEIKVNELDETDKNTIENLREKIEPWLTALFQSEHLSLLMGTGITSAVHKIANDNNPKGMGKMKFSVFHKQLEKSSEESAKKANRGTPNIEDQIRVANDFIQGMEIYLSAHPYGAKKLKKQLVTFKSDLEKNLSEFTNDILTTEKNIATSKMLEDSMDYLTNFLISFCSRSATRERLNLFTTNYDRLIEFGAELAGIRLIDRFVGSLNPVFRASRLEIDMHYNPPGIRGEPRYLEGVVHYTKLHGSIDWINEGNTIRRFALPFGTYRPIAEFFPQLPSGNGNIRQLMIYPNSNKDRETAEYPYVELFRDLASVICRPNATLVLYGYGFGDDHINRIIRDMLTIPSTHLVIIIFSDEGGRAKHFYDSVGRSAQISVLAGSHFGKLKNLVDYYLPKAAIDRTTIRMADLLKARAINTDTNQSDRGGK